MTNSADEAESQPVSYFSVNSEDSSPSLVSALRAWIALAGVPVLEGDIPEVAAILSGQLKSFEEVSRIDTDGMTVPEVQNPAW